jgi:hypothetical protein
MLQEYDFWYLSAGPEPRQYLVRSSSGGVERLFALGHALGSIGGGQYLFELRERARPPTLPAQLVLGRH